MSDVMGRSILNQIDNTFRLFMHMDENDYTIASLFAAMTNMRDVNGDFMPYYSGRLYIGSKRPGCGKSLLGKLLVPLCYNGKAVMNPTPPAMVANYHELKSTVAFEEFDQYMGRGNKPTITTIINGGWEQDAYVENVRQNVIVEYNITGPMILIGKNIQPFLTTEPFETIRTRSYIIALDRKPSDVEVMDFNPEVHKKMLKLMGEALKHWGMVSAPFIVNRQVKLPKGIDNRDKDIWTPLFRIADYIGGDWPRRVEKAARAKVLNEHDMNSMAFVTPYDELLAAVRAVFDTTDGDYIRTSDLIENLKAMPDAWWHYAWQNDRAASMSLSAALKSYEIAPVHKRIGDQVLSVYMRDDVMADDSRPVETVETSDECRDRRDHALTSVPDDGWEE